MGKLLGIAVRSGKRAEMQVLDRAHVSLINGVDNDFRGKPGARQVTVLTRESWEAACNEAHCDLPWFSRRANLLVEGVSLAHSQGQVLKIGDVKLVINLETDPCARMGELSLELERALALNWRGGVCCRVLEEGSIAVGSLVELVDGVEKI